MEEPTLVRAGWVATMMGFHNGNATTPDDLRAGYMTYVWLAEVIHDETGQNQLIEAYETRTGIRFPRD